MTDEALISPDARLALGGRSAFLTRCPVCSASASSPVIELDALVFSRCGGCGLIYKSESVATEGEVYGERYFRYNRAKYLAKWEHRVRKCRRQIIDCLQLNPSAKALCDIGCSAGYVLEAAKRLGLDPIGVDYSAFTVGLCRERGYCAEQGSLEALPLADQSLDIVTLKHTLEHVQRPLVALSEVRRVLKPGGVALIVVPDAAYWKISVMPKRGKAFRPDRRGWQHHVYFYEKNLIDAAERSGLEVLVRGKAIARSERSLLEALRFGWMRFYTWFGRVTHLRQEMQIIVRRPASGSPAPR